MTDLPATPDSPDDPAGPTVADPDEPGGTGDSGDPEEPGDPPPPEPGRTAVRYIIAHGKYLAKIAQEGAGPAQTYFLHTDMLGSIRAVTDSTGQVVTSFDYEPFGLLVEESGPASAGGERYTGKPLDAALGLYYFGARYYDPGLGRFIAADPARDGLNWYRYCAGNPLVHIDPDGNAYVILWSYSSSELQGYKGPEGTVDWSRFERECSFARAAQTK